MQTNPPNPQIELISRIGAQFDELQRSRAWWFVFAVAGWLAAGWHPEIVADEADAAVALFFGVDAMFDTIVPAPGRAPGAGRKFPQVKVVHT